MSLDTGNKNKKGHLNWMTFCQSMFYCQRLLNLLANYQQIKSDIYSIDNQCNSCQYLSIQQITGKLNYAHIGMYFI